MTQAVYGAEMPRALAVREPAEDLKDISSRGFLLSPAFQQLLPMDMLKQAEGQRSYSDKEKCSSILGEVKSRIPSIRQQTEGSDSDELLARPHGKVTACQTQPQHWGSQARRILSLRPT